ncbi:alkylated DNA nucleotide flippase Atl1 [Actinomadura luteofluorescens]|uniref:Alkylated DNA nucleotide flippase Atl1 n=1 Tax=Actinomadura luteofluorescens TaxID=46163 RepID=A0A7Y9EQ20_9ACTN|nr:DUF262 domain-containing protein [Actinomadura luteofluorescens]NYD51858.1 alkylated DNA nucleotide flippase Atl1 [Actinomadura luteofluorescens]
MRAHEIAYFKLIEGDKQFQVPLYQRTYSWRKPEWTQLWDDILEQAETLGDGDRRTPHFIGSVVLAPGLMSAGDTQRWLVVDGQQRLTTLMLACCALRDRFRNLSPRDGERIHKQYLVNEYREELDFYRLLPTQADRAAFIACVDSDPTAGGNDGIGAAYRFFRDALIACAPDGDVETLKRLEVVLRAGLSVVEITAEAGDNVYRIFESLNNTGVRLGQTDLLRNYVFMLLPGGGERVYTKIWLPMQTELGAANLELLAWLDLVIRGDDRVKQSEVYRAQQRRLDEVVRSGGEQALEAEIAELRRRGSLLMRIVEPTREQDPVLRAVLERLQEWGGQISYPLALHMLDLLDRGAATTDQVSRALGYVESFLVRRMICHITTSNLNRILNSAPRELETDRPLDEAVRRYLSGPRRNWPSDEQLRQAILDAPFYWQGRANQRRFVLKRLEQSYQAREPVDFAAADLTIEHVMPQTATPEWLALLAEEITDENDPKELHSALLHTLGNLTLTAHNPALSNHPFERKQQILDDSALRMNREIADAPRWGKAEIRARGMALTDRAIRLWPPPLPGGADLEDERRSWVLLRRLLAEIPTGSWTTFSDLATVIGVPASRIGGYLGSRPGLENAHRVLTSEGTPSPSSRSRDDAPADPRDLLAVEGVPFSDTGVADPTRRLGPAALAASIGLDIADEERPAAHRFRSQLAEQGLELTALVDKILDHWQARGGSLHYGSSTEVSCRLQIPLPGSGKGWIWPLLIYPQTGVIEMAFRQLSTRPPFDALELRTELRDRIARIQGLHLPATDALASPNYPLALLADGGTDHLLEAMNWFIDRLKPLPETTASATPLATPDNTLIAEFETTMRSVYTRAKTEAGYNANQFLRMLTDYGGLATAKRLLANPRISEGFAALYERQRLDLTVEAHVLDPKFASLFTEAELQTARDWLTQFGYRP